LKIYGGRSSPKENCTSRLRRDTRNGKAKERGGRDSAKRVPSGQKKVQRKKVTEGEARVTPSRYLSHSAGGKKGA